MKRKSILTPVFFGIVALTAFLFIYYSGKVFVARAYIPRSSIILYTVLIIIAEQLPVHLPQDAEVTVGFAVVLSAILLFGKEASVLMIFVSVLVTELKRIKIMPFFKSLFNISLYVVMVGVAGFFYEFLGATPGKIDIYDDILNITALVVSYFLVNVGLLTICISLLGREKISHVFVKNFKWALPNYLALAPLGVLLSVIFIEVKIMGIILFLVPLLVARHSFKLYMNMKKVYFDTIQALVTAIEAKDPYTRGHSDRVAHYANLISNEMNLSEKYANSLNCAALLHDIGKIGVPEHILNKPGKLSEEEFEKVKTHPVLGATIVKKIDFMADSSLFIRYHHERQDGTGYPEGLIGDNIPLGAAILSVADAYDALTSDRPYRKAKSPEDAIEEIEKNSGTQFKPEVVRALKKALEKERDDSAT
ncbi:MAG: HD-GYP domain-containing protein [Thermoanaerobacterales bacterium]|nr:HD-GYP domain-containing protein [Thermoanaerobacterales bacterium]